MKILEKYDKNKKKELEQLLKERRKSEKELNKKLEKRADTKYTTKYLKENKKFLTENAMTIDTEEYKKMVEEMKKRFSD